jgi:putative ABC transport system substrate-binding protein
LARPRGRRPGHHICPFFAIQIAQLASLAARYGLASNCAGANEIRTAAAAGALMRYGTSSSTANHQAGIYVGCRPGDLPVMLPTRFELVINLKTAKALGIE